MTEERITSGYVDGNRGCGPEACICAATRAGEVKSRLLDTDFQALTIEENAVVSSMESLSTCIEKSTSTEDRQSQQLLAEDVMLLGATCVPFPAHRLSGSIGARRLLTPS